MNYFSNLAKKVCLRIYQIGKMESELEWEKTYMTPEMRSDIVKCALFVPFDIEEIKEIQIRLLKKSMDDYNPTA